MVTPTLATCRPTQPSMVQRLMDELFNQWRQGTQPIVLRISEATDKKLCAEMNAHAIMFYPNYAPVLTLAGAWFQGIPVRVVPNAEIFYFEG